MRITPKLGWKMKYNVCYTTSQQEKRIAWNLIFSINNKISNTSDCNFLKCKRWNQNWRFKKKKKRSFVLCGVSAEEVFLLCVVGLTFPFSHIVCPGPASSHSKTPYFHSIPSKSARWNERQCKCLVAGELRRPNCSVFCDGSPLLQSLLKSLSFRRLFL